MTLMTRLDHRAKDNNSFKLVQASSGAILAEVVLLDSIGNIKVSTIDDLYIVKPSGWSSLSTRKDPCLRK